MIVSITEAFSTVCMAVAAAVAVPCMPCEDILTSETMPFIIDSEEVIMLPAVDMISPATPPTVSPMLSNSRSHSNSVLYRSSHSLILRLSGLTLFLALASDTFFFAVVTFARAVDS